MQVITATDLARNTRKILDTVAGSGETFAVERNNVLVAKLVPSESTMGAAQALDGFRVTLSPRQAERWLADLRGSFDEAVRDPWA